MNSSFISTFQTQQEDNADLGGGISFRAVYDAAIVNCFFNRNRVLGDGIPGEGEGGGVYLERSYDIVVDDCRFWSNESRLTGGGLAGRFTDIEILNCEFKDNTTGFGGGGDVPVRGGGAFLWVAGGRIESNLFVGNQIDGTDFPSWANLLGGGLYYGAREELMSIVGNTVADNVIVPPSPFYGLSLGGGVVLEVVDIATVPVVFDNNIVAFNQSVDEGVYCLQTTPGEFDFENSSFDCNDVYGNTGGESGGFPVPCFEILPSATTDGNFSEDPLFCDGYHLHHDSPCRPGVLHDGVDCGLIGALDRPTPPPSPECIDPSSIPDVGMDEPPSGSDVQFQSILSCGQLPLQVNRNVGRIEWTIYAVDGRLCGSGILDGTRGSKVLDFREAGDLSSGVYYLRLTWGGSQTTRRITIVK